MVSLKPPRNVLMISVYVVGFLVVGAIFVVIGITTSRF